MDTVPDGSGILNWRRIDALITSSGQPTTAELEQLAQSGVTDIINLGLTTHELALPDEAGTVAGLGMAYTHIPVIFAAPTDNDFKLFTDALQAFEGKRVHVHCIFNWRVSAFFYRYRVQVLGWDESSARREMETVWTPDPVWTGYLAAHVKPDRKLDIAFWNYDRTRLLSDGAVRIDGVDARFHSARIVPEIFEAMIRRRAYDVSELGMTYFLRTFDENGRSPFVALPVFPVRSFRHGAIYINKGSGIRRPQDLAGKRIGELALYGHDAGVMPKGILSDEFGVRPEQSRWIIGGIDFPMDPIDFVPHPAPAGVEVEWAGKEVDLGGMLEAGDIDALISADVPKCVLAGSPRVGRLFENYEEVERDYFRRTGIFPIMHAVVVTRELAEDHPDIVRAVYRGFCAAKDGMQSQYVEGMTFNNMTTMHPWLTKLIGDNRALLGEDWWPYGIKANRAAIDCILRYHHEQGLTKRRFSVEDVFVSTLLDT